MASSHGKKINMSKVKNLKTSPLSAAVKTFEESKKQQNVFSCRKTENAKSETFSPFVSLSRLRRVQMFLRYEKRNIDAIVLIIGIDGRYNQGMHELANYLFFGLFETNQVKQKDARLTEEVYEDVVCSIRADRVDVYCNPINLPLLLPFIASWSNLRLHCLLENEYQNDDDDGEEFKIRSFITMVDGCRSIGIPYSCSRDQITKFDPMIIEQWPLIQAFGLDDFGGNGFFTMKFEVMDLSSALHAVYNMLDPVTLEHIVIEHVVLFEKHWSTMLSICDHHRSISLTNAVICESLATFFDHGTLGYHMDAANKKLLDKNRPFVLFGLDTCRRNLERILTGTNDNHVTKLQVSDDDSCSTYHMICQAMSPRGQIFCRRTYFFAADNSIFNVVGGEEKTDEQSESGNHFRIRISLLVMVYKACELAVYEAIRVYTATLNPIKAEDAAREILLEHCRQYNIPTLDSWIAKKENVVINIDHNARHTSIDQKSLEVNKPMAVVKYASATVYDIPSHGHNHREESLGSVSFAESFVDSSFRVQYSDQPDDINGSYAILTSIIPHHVSWSMIDVDMANSEKLTTFLKPKLPTYGSQLMPGYPATLGHVSGLSPALFHDGSLYVYEQLIVFTHEHVPSFALPLSKVSSISYYDGDSSSVLACFAVTFEELFARKYLPKCLICNGQNQIVFFLTPRTKAHRAFFADVLPSWKKRDSVKSLLNIWNSLPPDLISLYDQLQDQYLVASGNVTSRIHKAQSRIENLANFLQHLSFSSACDQPVPACHVDAVISASQRPAMKEDESSSDDDEDDDKNKLIQATSNKFLPSLHINNQHARVMTKQCREEEKLQYIRNFVSCRFCFRVILTVLVGSPGSYRDLICEDILRSAQFSCVVHAVDPFSVDEFHESLQKCLKEGSQDNEKVTRMLVLSSSLTNTADVIYAIHSFPDNKFPQLLSVGSVTVCVNYKDAFLEHFCTMPMLLENCRKGWVNNIVWTNTSSKDVQTETLQRIIRSTNDDAEFIFVEISDGSVAMKNSDLDLITSRSAFEDPSHVRSRYLSCPGWSAGKHQSAKGHPEMKRIKLRFQQPLNKSILVNRLRGLRKSLKKYPFSENMYYVQGEIFLMGIPKRQQLTYSTLANILSIESVDSKLKSFDRPSSESDTDSFLIFIGCQLGEEALKNWIRDCAGFNIEKKVHRTKETLTEKEIQKIHMEHHLNELPEGWFYNGHQYVCLDGERSDVHPHMETFLTNYLMKCNDEIDRYNAKINEETRKDLFDY